MSKSDGLGSERYERVTLLKVKGVKKATYAPGLKRLEVIMMLDDKCLKRPCPRA